MTDEERLMRYVIPEPNSGCHLWSGDMIHNGYGRFGRSSFTDRIGERLAHRVAYRVLVGPIPDGLTLDHLCRNRACVNVEHLEPVTMAVNAARGLSFSAENARKQTCQNGHELHPVQAKGRTRRACRTCHRASNQKYRATHSRPATGGWSADRPACVSCGESKLRHQAKGLCRRCYQRGWARQAVVGATSRERAVAA